MSSQLAFLVFVSFVISVRAFCPEGSTATFVRTSNVRPKDSISSRLASHRISTPSACHHLCISSNTSRNGDQRECGGYFLSHRDSVCVLVSNSFEPVVRQNLEVSPGWSYHRKICLKGKRPQTSNRELRNEKVTVARRQFKS